MKIFIKLFISIVFISNFSFAQDENLEKDKKEEKTNKNLPIKSERFFDLKTNEGSWMSLDISPDGQTIVFDLLGDIYSMPISGGKAKRITKGMSFDSHPKFSPDGNSLAYVSDKSGSNNVILCKG